MVEFDEQIPETKETKSLRSMSTPEEPTFIALRWTVLEKDFH